MKILTVIDSMKGSLTSQEANSIVAEVFRDEKIEVEEIAIADGGEGTVAAFLSNIGGEMISGNVHNLCGQQITATYGWVPSKNLAILEAAETCGLQFIDGTEATHPKNTHSYGLGEQILSAAKRGAKKIIIGLGGTGTIDGGIGLLHCLGVRFFESASEEVQPIPSNFHKIEQYKTDTLDERLQGIEFIIAADVTSKITGDTGAVQMFGQQKGLQPDELPSFEQQMMHYSQVLLKDEHSNEGDGAAGGIGLALRQVLGAEMRPGLDLLSEYAELEEKIEAADLIITGEGKIDSQSLQGKVPVGIGHIAQKYQKPVIAFVGSVHGEPDIFRQHGIQVIIPLIDQITTLELAMKEAKKNLERVAIRTKGTLFLLRDEEKS